MANATQAEIKTLQIVSMFRKCQCEKAHGDNTRCRVMNAEKALYEINPTIRGARQW